MSIILSKKRSGLKMGNLSTHEVAVNLYPAEILYLLEVDYPNRLM